LCFISASTWSASVGFNSLLSVVAVVCVVSVDALDPAGSDAVLEVVAAGAAGVAGGSTRATRFAGPGVTAVVCPIPKLVMPTVNPASVMAFQKLLLIVTPYVGVQIHIDRLAISRFDCLLRAPVRDKSIRL
jgi:hypothetical protein